MYRSVEVISTVLMFWASLIVCCAGGYDALTNQIYFVSKSDIKKIFGLAVRTWRSRRGISQEELAERAGLHRTYISDIERGERNVGLISIERLAIALDVPIATLFKNPEEVEQTPPRLAAGGAVDILFVEDNLADVELTLMALRRANITNRIQVARDGAEALDFLFGPAGSVSHPHPQPPQMILLDLNLPKINGLEVLRRVKSDPRTRDIPVVILTASKQERDFVMSKQLGAEAYIVKPVGFDNLSRVTPRLLMQWTLTKPGTKTD